MNFTMRGVWRELQVSARVNGLALPSRPWAVAAPEFSRIDSISSFCLPAAYTAMVGSHSRRNSSGCTFHSVDDAASLNMAQICVKRAIHRRA